MDGMHENLDEALCEFFKQRQDPGGSYTGTATFDDDPYPEQDADDI